MVTYNSIYYWKKLCISRLIQLLGSSAGKECSCNEGVKVKVTQSCLTLFYPTGYTVHGILLARILEWVAFPFSKGTSQPRGWTQASCIEGGFFTSRATRRSWFNSWVRKIPWWRAWQTHSIILTGRILWTEEPGRLQSMGSQRVGHDWTTKRWQRWYIPFYMHTHTHTHTCSSKLCCSRVNCTVFKFFISFYSIFLKNYVWLEDNWFTILWISHKYTCVPSLWTTLSPPFPPSHSSRSSQNTSWHMEVFYFFSN